jgi:hypothetical protein
LYRLTPKMSDALIISALGKAWETQGKGEVSCHEDYRADQWPLRDPGRGAWPGLQVATGGVTVECEECGKRSTHTKSAHIGSLITCECGKDHTATIREELVF